MSLMTYRVLSSYIVWKAVIKVWNSLYVYVFIQLRAYKHVEESIIKEQGKFYPLILSQTLKQVFPSVSKV